MVHTVLPVCAAKEIRALVVDDEASVAKSLSEVLRDERFVTEVAGDGAEALEKVNSFKPDIVFLDMWMPGWDGIETLSRIKGVAPNLPVIMISGHATISNALEAVKSGAFDFIEKPFNIDSVVVTALRALNVLEEKRSSTPAEGRRSGLLYQHLAMFEPISAGRNLGQRTLCDSAILYGQCLHSGMKSGLVLEPLPPNSGIHFAHLGGSSAVPLDVLNVDSTNLATTLRSGNTVAATIEHLMAVLHAYGISNLLIKSNGEIPIFDGSGLQFCSVIESTGIVEQTGDWFEIKIDSPIRITSEGKNGREEISIEPADRFSVTYELDYPAPVGRQTFTFSLDREEGFSVEAPWLRRFREEIAPARTFGFMRDLEKLQKAGLAAGGRLDNFILIGDDHIINTKLRFPDELARHKALDIFGDLFLLGRPMCGAVHAKMTGHSDNIRLLTAVRNQLRGLQCGKSLNA